ncbi:MAG TPA: sulfite exporter TauE/SafE family protein [Pseudobdellovibrionaceae bacterium]|nr:sulfite exporter TauE/SafE family protein [Pseudobdellovibrionaceae bacterium]
MELLGYVSAIVMGTVLGLMGGGGSILSVPIFVYLFHVPAMQATTYSLFVVGLSAAFGGLTYYRMGLVNKSVGIQFAIPSFFGIILMRRFVLPAIPEMLGHVQLWDHSILIGRNLIIMVVFAVIMILAAISMIRGAVSESHSQGNQIGWNWKLYLQGLLVGSLAGFVGAGGGFLIIPALVILVGISMKEAVGTSMWIIAAQSTVGVLSSWGQVEMNWRMLILFVACAFVGIQIGTRLSGKISNAKLKVAFGYFVLLMGVFILAQELLK